MQPRASSTKHSPSLAYLEREALLRHQTRISRRACRETTHNVVHSLKGRSHSKLLNAGVREAFAVGLAAPSNGLHRERLRVGEVRARAARTRAHERVGHAETPPADGRSISAGRRSSAYTSAARRQYRFV